MHKKGSRRLTAVSVLVAAACLALAVGGAPTGGGESSAAGCSGKPANAAAAHVQLMELSKMIDPSGKLGKLVSDFHPAAEAESPKVAAAAAAASNPAHGHEHHAHHDGDEMHAAASEVEPVKRETDTALATTTTSTPAPTTVAAVATTTVASTPTTTTTTTTVAPPAAVKSEQVSPAPAGANSTGSATAAPKVEETTEASNVTVNVFLQLAPLDAKTEEFLKDPNKAIGSSTTEAPAASSTTAAASTAQVSGSTTVAPATSQTAAAAPSSSTVAATAASSTQTEAASGPVDPKRARRRRRWATQAAAAAPAPAASTTTTTTSAPAVTAQQVVAAPSSTSTTQAAATTTSTTTTTTTTQAPSSAAPTTTTTTSTQAPTTASSPTTTTTTTAASAPSTTTTTTSAPVSTTTTTQATVELSARDLAVAASQSKPAVEAAAANPVEIVVTSVAVPSLATAAVAASTTTTTTTTTTTAAPTSTTSEAPVATAAPSSAAPAAASTTAKPAAPSYAQVARAAVAQATAAVQSAAAQVKHAAQSAAAAAAPASGRQLIANSFEETTNINIPSHSEQAEGARTITIRTLHHENLNEVKRAIGGTNQAGKPQQQQQQPRRPGCEGPQRENTIQDSKPQSVEFSALDNSNVIYDNDTEQAGQSSLSPAEETGASDKRAVAKFNDEHRPPPVGLNSSGSATQGANSASFVNSERADEEPQEPQDNYATCLLEPTSGSASGVSGRNLTGRLSFWQPIQNRGVMHLVARLRYEATPTIDAAESRPSRKRRESFQTLIERAPPAHMEVGSSAASPSHVAEREQLKRLAATRNLVIHQIWLDDCRQLADSSSSSPTTTRKLLAELKAVVTNGSHLVDIDSESTVGHFNLTGTNSIVDKCLHLIQLTPGALAGAPGSLARCKVAQSERLPPASELDQPAPASNIQPVREELLNSGPSAYNWSQPNVVASSSPPSAATSATGS